MKNFKNLFKTGGKEKNDREEEGTVYYIHPYQIDGMIENTDEIIHQLNAAIVIAEKMKKNSCEVGQFNIYKKVFHELWLGIAEQYNYINSVDICKHSDGKYIV